MPLKKFLISCETLKEGSLSQRAALVLITGTCKVAGLLLKASDKVGRGTRAQVFIEYLMMLVAIALFTIVFTTGSFFTKFRNNMDKTTEFAMDTMEQPGVDEPASNATGATIPWWNETIEEGGLGWWSMPW